MPARKALKMLNGHFKWAFIQRFSTQLSLKVLYNIGDHSPIHALIHTPTSVSAMHSDGQLVGSSQGEVSRSGDASTLTARRSRGSN